MNHATVLVAGASKAVGRRRSSHQRGAAAVVPGRPRQAECKYGHALKPGNLYKTRDGKRECRECRRARAKGCTNRKQIERRAIHPTIANLLRQKYKHKTPTRSQVLTQILHGSKGGWNPVKDIKAHRLAVEDCFFASRPKHITLLREAAADYDALLLREKAAKKRGRPRKAQSGPFYVGHKARRVT